LSFGTPLAVANVKPPLPKAPVSRSSVAGDEGLGEGLALLNDDETLQVFGPDIAELANQVNVVDGEYIALVYRQCDVDLLTIWGNADLGRGQLKVRITAVFVKRLDGF
jgi:hypothetical protein